MTGTAVTPLDQVREELAPMKSQFEHTLPSHISPDKFAQVCLTAIENNPDLLTADRQSFKVACLNAATDGLLPDKREGAFVIFNTEVDVREEGKAATYKKKVKLVQWMPMITGILKKAYQTEKVSSIAVELVHKNDTYRRAAGDNAEIVHEPLDFGDRGEVIGGYAIIRMRDGGDPYREVMSRDQIEKVRAVSRTRNGGPWFTFWEEMAKKTILRRALKRVPLSAEVDRVLARDEAFYTLESGDRPMQIAAATGERVPRKALFSSKPAVRRKVQEIEDASVQGEQQGAPADGADDVAVLETQAGASPDAADGEVGAVDETALIKAVTAIRDAESLSGILVAVDAALPLCADDEERAWVNEMAAARRKDLGPEPFSLTAIISSATGPRQYDDANLWRDDLLTKMDSLSGDLLAAFWKKNLKHVLDAGENGFDEQAERVLDVARGRNLTTEVHDG